MVASPTPSPIARPTSTDRRSGAGRSASGESSIEYAIVGPVPSPSLLRRLLLLAAVLAAAACSSSGQTKSDQGRSIAEDAGLPEDVADFFATATAPPTTAFRVVYEISDKDGKPSQV